MRKRKEKRESVMTYVNTTVAPTECFDYDHLRNNPELASTDNHIDIQIIERP